jgi:uncharacterized membrane protein
MHYFSDRRHSPAKRGRAACTLSMPKGMKLNVLLVFVAVAAAPVVAPLLAGSHPLATLLIRSFYSRLCHQDAARSFVVAGSPVAVCVRCLGIYCGVVGGLFLRTGKSVAARLLAGALLLNLLDVIAGMIHWHGSQPGPRFLLGLLLGMGAGAILSAPRAAAGGDEAASMLHSQI